MNSTGLLCSCVISSGYGQPMFSYTSSDKHCAAMNGISRMAATIGPLTGSLLPCEMSISGMKHVIVPLQISADHFCYVVVFADEGDAEELHCLEIVALFISHSLRRLFGRRLLVLLKFLSQQMAEMMKADTLAASLNETAFSGADGIEEEQLADLFPDDPNIQEEFSLFEEYFMQRVLDGAGITISRALLDPLIRLGTERPSAVGIAFGSESSKGCARRGGDEDSGTSVLPPHYPLSSERLSLDSTGKKGMDVYLLQYNHNAADGDQAIDFIHQPVADTLHTALGVQINAAPSNKAMNNNISSSLVLPEAEESEMLLAAPLISAEWQQVIINLCSSWTNIELPISAADAVKKHTRIVYFRTTMTDTNLITAYLVCPLTEKFALALCSTLSSLLRDGGINSFREGGSRAIIISGYRNIDAAVQAAWVEVYSRFAAIFGDHHDGAAASDPQVTEQVIDALFPTESTKTTASAEAFSVGLQL